MRFLPDISAMARPLASGLACAAIALLGSQPAQAATLTVCADGSADHTTIQAAVDAAASGDTIDICAGVHTEAGIAIINKDNLTIQGQGQETTIVQAAASVGAATDRVFVVVDSDSTEFVALGIRHGNPTDGSGEFDNAGGGVYLEDSDTEFNACTISDNFSSFGGGGIFSVGGEVILGGSTVTRNTVISGIPVEFEPDDPDQLIVSGVGGGGVATLYTLFGAFDSTISDNSTDRWGGGVSQALSFFFLIKTTVSGNSAINDDSTGLGGGVASVLNLPFVFPYSLTDASTVSGNTANVGGGVAAWDAAVAVVNSTVTGNSAELVGGGLFTVDSPFDEEFEAILGVGNSIVAGNTAGEFGGDCFVESAFENFGPNLDSDGSCPDFSQPNSDPLLGPLADNGGPNLTHALGVGSPAIDQGDPGLCAAFAGPVDQRGVARPSGPTCDLGAYEFTGTVINGCLLDDFNDDTLDVVFGLSDLGDAAGGAAAETGGAIDLTGTGTELYHGADNGAFLSRSVNGDFRVEVDLTGVPGDTGGTYRKGGLMVRESNDPNAPRVMVNLVPHFPDPAQPDTPALQFDVRTTQGGTPVEMASTVVGINLPVRVAIQRVDDQVTVLYSTDDGLSWIHPLGGVGGTIAVPMTDTVQAGMVVASYDAAQSATFRFDDFAVCQPGGIAPVTVDLGCNEDQAIDYVYLFDISGSMLLNSGDDNKMNTAKAALAQLSTTLAAQNDGSRVALVTYRGNDSRIFNLTQGAEIQSGFTTDFAAVDALVQVAGNDTISPSDTSRDTSTAAIGLARTLDLLMAERDPSHGVVLVWATDGLPNIDAEGRGHFEYRSFEVAAIDPSDGSGGWLPPGVVAWQGGFNPSIATFDGQVVADAMSRVIDLRADQGNLRIFPLVPRTVASEALLDFAADHTQGTVLGGEGPAALAAQVPALLTAVDCGNEGDAILSGRVWHDLNENGVDDAGEPGLAGVTVTVGAVTVDTDGDGNYSASVPAGSTTLSVDSGDLPAGIDQPTADPDGTGSAHTATISVAAWDVTNGLSFGYSDAGGGPLVGCLDDDFEDGAVGSAWSLASLGNADQVSVTETGGALQLTGDGTTAYAGSDNGGFIYQEINGDFRAEVDVTGFPVDAGGAYRKAGLMVRAGLGSYAARVMVQYVPDFAGNGPALQFRARTSDGGPGDVALGSNLFGIALPVRLAIERVGNDYIVEYSTNGGGTWLSPAGGTGGSVTVDLGAEPLVGMNTVSYSANTTLTAEFDNFSVCGDDPPPPATGYNCSDNNPCTPENIANGLFYWQMDDPGMFVQCGMYGSCYEMSCPPGLVWDDDAVTCVYP